MKKKTTLLLAGAFMGAVIISGCGKQKTAEPAESTEKTENSADSKKDTDSYADAPEASEQSNNPENKEKETQEGTPEEEEAPPQNPVGVLLPGEPGAEEWSESVEVLTLQLERDGFTPEVYYAGGDPNVQRHQLEAVIAGEPEALVVAPVDPWGLHDIMDAGDLSDIPVISYVDLLMDTDAVTYYVGFDTRKAGQQAGEQLIEKLTLDKCREEQRSMTIEFMMGDRHELQNLFYYNGLMEIIGPYLEDGTLVCLSGRISYEDVCCEKGNTIQAGKRLDKALKSCYENRRLDILCTGSDELALTGLRILRNQNILPSGMPYITGVGCKPEIVSEFASGIHGFSLFQDERTLAQTCADTLKDYMEGEKPEVSDYQQYDNGTKIIRTITCESEIIDGDNYQMLVDNGYYSAGTLVLPSPAAVSPRAFSTDGRALN